MAQLLIHNTVEDYARWKRVFDEYSPNRVMKGSKGYRLLRKSDNPNEVFIIFEWDTIENARAFATSDELKAAMQRAGASSVPEIHFLEETEISDEGSEEARKTA